MTKEKDIVLIYIENKPVSFARVEKIIPDAKPEWFQVKLMLLQIPVDTATWILRKSYINGDKFTMGGQIIYLEKIVCPGQSLEKKDKKTSHDNVIPLFDN